MNTTPKDVANWMMQELKKDNFLSQDYAVNDINNEFGDEFTYLNDNGNLSISKAVLSAFKKLSGDNVVWDRWGKSWRFRNDNDLPGRQQE